MFSAIPLLLSLSAHADPCGMVPPAWVPPGDPGIVRMGEQVTYSFFKEGVQTIAIRPGFVGNVEEFGMLVPLPAVPALRKIDDRTFGQMVAVVDPPVVTVQIYDDIPMPVALFADMRQCRSLCCNLFRGLIALIFKQLYAMNATAKQFDNGDRT